MPPWLPSDKGLPLQSHRGLPKGDIKVISDWIQAGHPLGSLPEVMVNQSNATASDDPDVLIGMPVSWDIPAEGGINWGRRERDKRTFVLPMNNDRELRVQRIRYESSAPKAVHAVSFLADPTGHARGVDDREGGPGHYMTGDVLDTPSGSMGMVGVGSRSILLPDGYHWEIPPQSDMVMQVHFRPTGRSVPLQDSLLLWLADDQTTSRPVRTLLNMVWRVDVKADESTQLKESWLVPVDVDLLGFSIRGSGVLTKLQLTARLPDGRIVNLLDIPQYDPHWRQTWLLDDTWHLPAGTEVTGSWTLENTEANPRNPFVPLDRYVAARRTGVLATMLHVAASNEEDDQQLMTWHRGMVRSRPRAQRVIESSSDSLIEKP